MCATTATTKTDRKRTTRPGADQVTEHASSKCYAFRNFSGILATTVSTQHQRKHECVEKLQVYSNVNRCEIQALQRCATPRSRRDACRAPLACMQGVKRHCFFPFTLCCCCSGNSRRETLVNRRCVQLKLAFARASLRNCCCGWRPRPNV